MYGLPTVLLLLLLVVVVVVVLVVVVVVVCCCYCSSSSFRIPSKAHAREKERPFSTTTDRTFLKLSSDSRQRLQINLDPTSAVPRSAAMGL